MNKINTDNLNGGNKEHFAEGIMLDEDSHAWKKEIMIAQIMIYLQQGIATYSLNIIYGKEHVDTALSLFKPCSVR